MPTNWSYPYLPDSTGDVCERQERMNKKLPKTKIGYKLVMNYQFKLVSCMHPYLDDWTIVEYKIGFPVTPRRKCGPLCVFTSLEAAKFFAGEFEFMHKFNKYGKPELYRCKYIPSKETTIWAVDDENPIRIHYLPDGTALAKSVTLLEKIGFSGDSK